MDTSRRSTDYGITLDNLIIEVYDAALSRKWSRVLDICNQFFAVNKSFILLRDKLNNSFETFKIRSTISLPNDALRYYKSHFSADPFHQKAQMLSEGDILSTESNSIINWAEHQDYLNFVLKPLKSERSLVALLLVDDRYEAYFGVCRSADDPPFSDDEHARFSKLVPHVVRASRFFRDTERYHRDQLLAQGVFDHLQTPFVVCNRYLRVMAMNKYADEFFSQSDVLYVEKSRLRVQPAKVYAQLLDIMEKSESDGRFARQSHTILIENMDVLIFLTVSQLGCQSEQSAEQPTLLIQFTVKAVPDWREVQERYDFSRKETLIARLLYKEANEKDIADSLALEEREVQVLVASVFHKSGASDKAEFSRLLVTLSYFQS